MSELECILCEIRATAILLRDKPESAKSAAMILDLIADKLAKHV
jgi:hypothetical protein